MRRRTTALALLLVVATACGSDDPAAKDPATVGEDDFLGGTCLVLAQDVIAMREFAVATLRADPARASIEIGDNRALSESEDRLREGESRAGDALAGPLTELVDALEDVQRRIDANTYDGPQYVERVRDAADDVIAVCT